MGAISEEGRINDSTVHDQACIIQRFIDVVKDGLPKAMRFQKMSEFQQGGSVRDRFRHEVQPHIFPHAVADIDGIFDTDIKRIKPDLQERKTNTLTH